MFAPVRGVGVDVCMYVHYIHTVPWQGAYICFGFLDSGGMTWRRTLRLPTCVVLLCMEPLWTMLLSWPRYVWFVWPYVGDDYTVCVVTTFA